ncbi:MULTISPECIES: ketopantoate reductase family protein [Rhodomicrobium]|uniref:ketopantoate reductase family protein n=1 Tax=Rhodomicrobium TaxID=1068 RepID=UPI000B4B8C65|nr:MULTISPECIES: ketopantoate reductase family protein [Rhodomicrobium]
MRLLVVGAGATGGYFGGRLAGAGRDVTFLVRPKRAEALRANGLQILSPHGDLTLTPKTVTAADLAEKFDAILLSVKAYSLDAAIEDFAPAVGPGTMILPVLNGMRHMDVLTARFGAEAVAGSVCRVAADIDAEGRIVQMAKFHELAYGERDGTISPRMEQLDAFMQGAGFDARLLPEIEREMWEKWTLLASLALTCMLRGNVGEIVAAHGGAEIAERFVGEVVAVISAVGKAPRPEVVETVRGTLTLAGSTVSPSMYRDMSKGAPIEADQIIGDLLARAQGAGIPVPLLEVVYASLSIYQNRLAAKAA